MNPKVGPTDPQGQHYGALRNPKIQMNPNRNPKKPVFYKKAEKRAKQPKERPAKNTKDLETTTRRLKI